MSADTPFETVLHAPAPVAGIIFDMDGTLVDNMHVHNDAWEVWHQRRGLPFDRATFFQATAGRANREVVRAAMPDASELELDTLGLDKETIYREIYSGRMAPMPGLLDFIESVLESSGGTATIVEGYDAAKLQDVLKQTQENLKAAG